MITFSERWPSDAEGTDGKWAEHDYDMAVIGSGPGGHGAAIQASKLGKKVVVLEKQSDIGGETVNVGTPSKTVREAALYLTGYRERNIYGESYAIKDKITMGDLMVRTRYVMEHQAEYAAQPAYPSPGGHG